MSLCSSKAHIAFKIVFTCTRKTVNMHIIVRVLHFSEHYDAFYYPVFVQIYNINGKSDSTYIFITNKSIMIFNCVNKNLFKIICIFLLYFTFQHCDAINFYSDV